MFALGGIWGTFWAPSPALPEQSATGDVLEHVYPGADAARLVALEKSAIGRVPESHTDSIFCVIGERFGIAGALLLISLYAGSSFGAGSHIAGNRRAEARSGRLVAVGVTTFIGVQAANNMGMLVGLLPITGVSLPLVSYGGSGLIANCLALGLLANLALRPGYEMTADPFVWQARG